MLRNNVVLDSYKPNQLSLIEKIKLPNNFVQLITTKTQEYFGESWYIKIIANTSTELDSIEEQEDKINKEKITKFATTDEFHKIKNIFPEAKIISVEPA